MARQKGPSDEELVAADLQEQLKHTFAVHEKGLRLVVMLHEITREFNIETGLLVTKPSGDKGFVISYKDKWSDLVRLDTNETHRHTWDCALEAAELHLNEMIEAREKARESARLRALAASKLTKAEREVLGIDSQGNYYLHARAGSDENFN